MNQNVPSSQQAQSMAKPGIKRMPIVIAVAAIAGFVAGIVLRGLFAPTVTPAAPIGIPSEQSTADVTGWCCTRQSDSCVASDSPVTCLEDGGRGYHKTQDGCDRFCAFLSTR